MLELTVPATEYFNEETNEFFYTHEITIQLEHSLVSLSKWEEKWCKPFLGTTKLSKEEMLDYVRCMTINKNVDSVIYYAIDDSQLKLIDDYINSKHTATYFSKTNAPQRSRDIITSEIIYYWMVALNIPFDCQKWHLNRLLTLIEVCNIKNKQPKNMSRRDIVSQNRALNAARKKRLNSNG